MQSKVSYAAVGLFVLALGIAFIALLLWLGAGRYAQIAYERYYAYMRESVSGLSVNAPVKYRGVEVGKVNEIVLDPGNSELVRLSLDIVDGTPIKTDTVAVLSVQGLTGIAFVDLTGGSHDAPILKAKTGEKYPVIAAGPSLLARVDKALTQALDNVNRLTDDVHALLEPKNREALASILAHIDKLTAALASRDSALQQGIDHVARASADLPELVRGIRDAAQSLQHMADQLAASGAGLAQTVEHSRHDMEAFTQQSLPEAAQLVSNLRELSADLQRLTQQLEQDPSALLYGRRTVPAGPGE